MLLTFLSTTAGIVTSLVFKWFPSARKRFDKLSKNKKRLFMLGMLALTTLGSYLIACHAAGLGGLFTIPIECTEAGIIELAQAFFAAVAGNQFTYLIAPEKENDRRVLKGGEKDETYHGRG